MTKNNERRENQGDDSPTPAKRNVDLTDSPADEQRMKQEEVTLDLPDVSDIPGQENIIPPRMGEFADTTISSDDEEGTRVFGEDDQEGNNINDDI
jgi:hypothetical protein